jgi:hypothetical protein
MSFHYQFAAGQWLAIQDPLKGVLASQYGFDMQTSTESVMCCGMNLRIYARTSLAVAFPFKFYVQLHLASVECLIWLPDLPDVFALLKELPASFESAALRSLLQQGETTLGAAVRSGDFTVVVKESI